MESWKKELEGEEMTINRMKKIYNYTKVLCILRGIVEIVSDLKIFKIFLTINCYLKKSVKDMVLVDHKG